MSGSKMRLDLVDTLFLITEGVLFVSFLGFDALALNVELSSILKYSGIVVCFIFALYRFARFRTLSSVLVVAALLFTMVADHFLLLAGRFVAGILCFCVTQTLYMVILTSSRESKGVRITNELILCLPPAAAGAWLAGKYTPGAEPLVCAAAFYACSFIRNLVLAVGLNCRKEKIEGIELRLFTAGLCVFMACDINVLIYNLPNFVEITSRVGKAAVEAAGMLMWFFYLPSQVMIVLSVFGRGKKKVKL